MCIRDRGRVCSGAFARSSIEASSGSLFISQKAIGGNGERRRQEKEKVSATNRGPHS